MKFILLILALVCVLLLAGCDDPLIQGDAVADQGQAREEPVMEEQPVPEEPVVKEEAETSNITVVEEADDSPKCFSDSDCDDGYDCSIDTCEYAGTKYAYCNHEEVTRRTSTQTDGCCPSWENADTDMDCEPVCGNGICEFGEMEATCKVDCENAGGSATGVAAPIGRATAK